MDPESETALNVERVMYEEEDVKSERIVLGHSESMLGMDRFGLNVNATFEERADTLVEMCRCGYAEQMVLSHAVNCFFD